MEILKLIKKDHGEIKNLFKRVEQCAEIPGIETEDLVSKLVTEILLHAKSEEKALYTHCRQRTEKLREFALEGHVEHKVLEITLKRLSIVPPGPDGKFKAVLKVAKELFTHHAIEEEESSTFPKIMKAFSEEEREELGTLMAAIKEKLRGNPNNFEFKEPKIRGAQKNSRTAGASASESLVRAEGSDPSGTIDANFAGPAIGPEGVVQAIRPENHASPGAAGAVPSRNPKLVPSAVVPSPSAGLADEKNSADEAPRSDQLKRAV